MTSPPNEKAAPSANRGRQKTHDGRESITTTSHGKRPFIPAWLDDAGLSAAEMRVFVHLLRSADNVTGIAWPSYQRMTEITGMGKSTVRRCLEELEGRGFIAKAGKPFGGSCRYRVLANSSASGPTGTPIVPPQGQMEPSNSSATGTIDNAPIVPPQDCNSPSDGTPIVPPQGQEGSPKKVLQRRESNNGEKHPPSETALAFADWFKSTLPETVNLKTNWRQSFATIYDKLVRLDGRKPEDIREVCQWARNDSFWKSNFMSPSKLRDRNPGGIQYFDILAERMNQPSASGSKPITTIDTGNRKSSIESAYK